MESKVTARLRFSGSMEQHFLLCVYLMVLFFFVDLATDALLAFHLTTVKIGGTRAADTFLALFGVALGIFRGMNADKPREDAGGGESDR